MKIRSLLLGSVALAGLPLFAPEGLGDGGAAVSEPQSYDPAGPNYVSPDVFNMLSPEAQARVVTVDPRTGSAFDPALNVPTAPANLDDHLAQIDNRLDALEFAQDNFDRAEQPTTGNTLTPKQTALLAWAETVFNKWHTNEKPQDFPADDSVTATDSERGIV